MHPGQGGELDVFDGPPRALQADQFTLLDPEDRLGQGAVMRVAPGADRRGRADLGQSFSATDGQAYGMGVPSGSQIVSYGIVSLLIIAIPGPSVLFAVGQALSRGRRSALASVVAQFDGQQKRREVERRAVPVTRAARRLRGSWHRRLEMLPQKSRQAVPRPHLLGTEQCPPTAENERTTRRLARRSAAQDERPLRRLRGCLSDYARRALFRARHTTVSVRGRRHPLK